MAMARCACPTYGDHAAAKTEGVRVEERINRENKKRMRDQSSHAKFKRTILSNTIIFKFIVNSTWC